MRKKEEKYVTREEFHVVIKEVKDAIELSAQNVIKVIIDYIDERCATKEDLAEVKSDLAGVKKDLAGVKKDLAGVKKELSEVKKDLTGVKDDILQFKDDILHEIVDLRDDVAVVTSYREMIEDHEVRITNVEKKKVH